MLLVTTSWDWIGLGSLGLAVLGGLVHVVWKLAKMDSTLKDNSLQTAITRRRTAKIRKVQDAVGVELVKTNKSHSEKMDALTKSQEALRGEFKMAIEHAPTCDLDRIKIHERLAEGGKEIEALRAAVEEVKNKIVAPPIVLDIRQATKLDKETGGSDVK